jgi:hypothetical protein
VTRLRAPKPGRPRARRWFDMRAPDRREPTGETRPTCPDNSVRAAFLTLVVALNAVAFATLLRPRHGYTSTHRLLIVLAVGAGAAVGALLLAGAGAAFRRRPERSLWSATAAVPTISFVLAVFIAAAVASQLVRAIRPAAGSQGGASATAARADFQRWQETVVPIVVQWMHTIREDSTFTHGLPSTPERALRRRVERSEQTFVRLARSLAADSPRLPQRPELRRLTNQLKTALAVARRAQRTYALALAAATPGGVARRLHGARIQRLIARGNAEAQRSLAIMAAFSFDANKLGGSLFVGQP